MNKRRVKKNRRERTKIGEKRGGKRRKPVEKERGGKVGKEAKKYREKKLRQRHTARYREKG